MEAHEAHEVNEHVRALQAARATLNRAAAPTAKLVEDDHDEPEGKLVYLVRHGEGAHNVAQREWRAAGNASEPYTVATDHEFSYVDAELTPKGVGQAEALQPRFAALRRRPELLVVSPMRRATLTGLTALAALEPPVPAVAIESCHETGGRHTCDKRLDRSALAALYPTVSYAELTSEADPLWDTVKRETPADVAARASTFAAWLRARPERVVVVAAHSGFLLALCNAVFDSEDDRLRDWFGTGECRAVWVTW